MDRSYGANPLEKLRFGDKVFVKIISQNKGKIYMRMKDIDQKTGEDLRALKKKHIQDRLKNAIFKDEFGKDGRTFGSITGIKVDDKPVKKRERDRLNSPDMWEMSR